MATADAGSTGRATGLPDTSEPPHGALSKGGCIMWKAVAPVLTALCLFPAVQPAASAGAKPAPTLDSDLRAELPKGGAVPARDGRVPVRLTFVNHTDKEQVFANTEYRFAILDRDGRQVKGALAITDEEARAIVLRGRSTTDTPPVFVREGKLKAGEEYFLVVSVRDLIGHVKFTAE
jgi:hypothetical protein